MNRRHFLQTASIATLAPTITWGAGNPAEKKTGEKEEQLKRWLRLAEQLRPKLHETTQTPRTIVHPIADSARFLRWQMDMVSPASALREQLMRAGDTVILDFGEYLTGHLAFSITGEGRGVDAPARINSGKFTTRRTRSCPRMARP